MDNKLVSEAAVARWGTRCPCCNKHMRTDKNVQGAKVPRDKRTRGHDFATAFGGNGWLWVYMCFGCNADQASLDLVTWSRQLNRDADPRSLPALELAVFIRSWAAERGYKGHAKLPTVPGPALEKLRAHVEAARRGMADGTTVGGSVVRPADISGGPDAAG